MTRFTVIVGRVIYLLAWPVSYVYLRSSHRTRVVVSSKDKILVVKNIIGKNEWGLPGGGLHKNERSIDGAIRELYEETGIKMAASDLKPIFENRQVSEDHASFYIDGYITNLKRLTVPTPITKEIAEARWVDQEELLKNYKLQGHARDILETLLKR